MKRIGIEIEAMELPIGDVSDQEIEFAAETLARLVKHDTRERLKLAREDMRRGASDEEVRQRHGVAIDRKAKEKPNGV